MPTVLIVGGGGREHAIAHALTQSKLRPQIVVAPGNPGIASIARCVDVAAGQLDALVELAAVLRADLVIVGPEAPLVAGLADRLKAARFAVLGASAAAARLEGSKAFAKEVMREARVPTADARACRTREEALAMIHAHEGRVAVKADGLAAGKGVVVANDVPEAEAAVDALLGPHGLLVVEEKLEGEELSIIALADGERVAILAPAQDHKRLLEGDRGPNTGGMGAYAPAPGGTGELLAQVEQECLLPVLDVMRSRGTPFCGVLYCGLMLTADGPKVLEFNTRFGDPEAQVILPLLADDPFEVLHAAATGALPARPLRMRAQAALTVVLAAQGYPDNPRAGDVIGGLDHLADRPNILVFHAGTRRDGDRLLTAGGRVLNVTGLGPDLEAAACTAYAAVGEVHWPGIQYRRDIGHRALSKDFG